MEIRITVLELSKALSLLQGVAQKKNTMPILAHVLLEAQGNTLRLSVTDLDIGLQISRGCEVAQPGAITVLAKSLLDIVRFLPGPHVTLITLPNQHLLVKSAKTQARLLALPPEEFPRLPDITGIELHRIPTASWVGAIQKTIYSASMDENRYNLAGVYLEPAKNQEDPLLFVSTDGHRLSRYMLRLNADEAYLKQPVILPRKGLVEMIKILEPHVSSDKHTFEIGFSHHQVVMKTEDTLLTMRMIDGKFPDYNQVIPKISDKIVRANRADFAASLKRVSVLTNDRNQSVKLAMKPSELTVSCTNPEAGEVSDDVPIEYSGPEMNIAFSVSYLIEALNSISEQNIMMRYIDSYSPVILTGIHNDDHLCLIMPIRI
ncbi:MAG: DNA polymerase III subunit beta [Deltaproteobacteria bacterium]|nr:DNA polymerase III subunit beta [Deltaproteobacteria bacterium]